MDVAPGVQTSVRVYGDADARTLILAHGAGAGHQSQFMVACAGALSDLDISVVTFNFIYTEQGRRLPDRPALLERCYRAVIAAVRDEIGDRPLFAGGKSMGGRIATQVAAADPGLDLAGLVLLGYPLHPPGKPDQRRDAHLPSVAAPLLFVQGSRDTFGTPAELAPVLARIGDRATLHVVEGGDHSFKVSGNDREEQNAVHAGLYRRVADWMTAITDTSARTRPRPA